MNRKQLFHLISSEYGIEPEYPWLSDPDSCVFRHAEGRKWFGVCMRVKNSTLGISGEGITDILNVKCDPIMVDSLKMTEGYFPAYHMNKDLWISIDINNAPHDNILYLIEQSYRVTFNKRKKRKSDEDI